MFKIGNKVRILDGNYAPEECVGQIGTITAIKCDGRSIAVVPEEQLERFKGKHWYYEPEQLELLEPAKLSVLDTPMAADNDAGAATIKDYLKALLVALIEEGEEFSGKRPLGNSDWQYQIYDAIAEAGLLPAEGSFTKSYARIYQEADELIIEAIKEL